MDQMIQLFQLDNVWLGVALVGFAGMVEYLLPPFPGDTLMLFGFFLAGHGDLPLAAVFAAAFLGSALGAELAYQLGARLGGSYFFLQRSRFAKRALPTIQRYFARFGTPMILVNRFLPVVRGFFLYSAGMGKMPRGATFLYASLSNLAWILLIAWVGHHFGSSWERLQTVFKAYSGFIGVILLVYLGITFFRFRVREGTRSSA